MSVEVCLPYLSYSLWSRQNERGQGVQAVSVSILIPSEMALNYVEKCYNCKMCIFEACKFVCCPADDSTVCKSLLISNTEKLLKETKFLASKVCLRCAKAYL